MTPKDDLVEGLAIAYRDHDPEAINRSLSAALSRMLGTGLTSIWHPLGFFRIEVGTDADGNRYVVHGWPEGQRSTQDPAWTIHRHVWPLDSYILGGVMRDEQYDITLAEGKGPSGVLYLARSAPDGQSVLDKTDEKLRLIQVGDLEYEPGQFYHVGLNAFHQSDVDLRRRCLTLVRIGHRERARSQVLGELNGPIQLRYKHKLADQDLVLDQLRRTGLSL